MGTLPNLGEKFQLAVPKLEPPIFTDGTNRGRICIWYVVWIIKKALSTRLFINVYQISLNITKVDLVIVFYWKFEVSWLENEIYKLNKMVISVHADQVCLSL